MSLVPMLFSNWWEELDRPHRLLDQNFGLPVDPQELFDELDSLSDVVLYRPTRSRHRRRYHPFLNTVAKRGHHRGASTVQADKNKFLVTLDVQQFAPDEIKVKVVDRNVVVEAKHEEKEDEHGWISRQFVRKYLVPTQCDIDQVESHLSSDGILTITCPRKEAPQNESNEKTIKIQFTGQPAIRDVEAAGGDSSEMVNDVSRDQQQQQQQQQRGQQQQQGQRGRKGNVKAA